VDWLYDLRQAGDLEPEHLSCYMLTCESDTPLAKDVKTGRIRWAPEEMILDCFNTAIDFLTARSFLHYEVSNFARIAGPHHEPRISRHNLKYWTFAPYIGFGPSAHSFIKPERYWNHRDLTAYLRQIEGGKSALAERESLTKTQMTIEAIYLGLRTTWGINLAEFQAKSGINFTKAFDRPIVELENQGMIEINEGHCKLTRKGLLFIDSIASMFICHDAMSQLPEAGD
jgi:oxygen-independent coproporphyrinogen-3 oxidase